MSKSRTYSFTWNNYPSDVETVLRALLGVKYMCYGKEVAPSTGTPHLQGMVVWTSQRSQSAVVKALPGCHVEPAIVESALLKYVRKDGDITEWGIRPVLKAQKGALETARWDKARELAKSGKLDEVDSDIYLRYYRTLKEIRKDHMPGLEPLPVLDNEWVYGPTGTGKTRTALALHPGAYLKPANKWWDGYAGEEVVIIDDFDKYHKSLGYELKIWGDHNPFIAETKGGAMKIRPRKIIITSNYCPGDIWEDPQTVLPICRRFNLKYHNTV